MMKELPAIEIADIPRPHILAESIILLAIDKRLALCCSIQHWFHMASEVMEEI